MLRKWSIIPQYIYIVRRKDGCMMTASVIGIPDTQNWIAVAIFSSQSIKNVDDLFNDHSHKSFGIIHGLANAQAIVEKFARKWLRSKAVTDRCECGEEEGSAMLVRPPRGRV